MDKQHKHERKRIPVTPELEASAFRDPAARALLLKAREARMRQDSALLAYDATAYQRISAGLGFRAFGRDRLLFRTENVSRVRWSRDNGAWVDVKGARTRDPDGEGRGCRFDPEDMSPIPYYPGREALWIGNGVAKAEVDPDRDDPSVGRSGPRRTIASRPATRSRSGSRTARRSRSASFASSRVGRTGDCPSGRSGST